MHTDTDDSSDEDAANRPEKQQQQRQHMVRNDQTNKQTASNAIPKVRVKAEITNEAGPSRPVRIDSDLEIFEAENDVVDISSDSGGENCGADQSKGQNNLVTKRTIKLENDSTKSNNSVGPNWEYVETESESSEVESNATEPDRQSQNAQRKRNAEAASIDDNVPSATNVHNYPNFGIKFGLLYYEKEFANAAKNSFGGLKQMFGNLQRELNRANNEKTVLEHEKDVLRDEQKAWVQERAKLRDENEALKQQIVQLEANKTKTYCAHCEIALKTFLFCGSDCAKKHFK